MGLMKNGLGQIGARLADLEGAEVYVAEIKEDVWEQAKAALCWAAWASSKPPSTRTP